MKFQGSVIMNNGILFLDIDGVLNSHTYYEELVDIYSINGFHKLTNNEKTFIYKTNRNC